MKTMIRVEAQLYITLTFDESKIEFVIFSLNELTSNQQFN